MSRQSSGLRWVDFSKEVTKHGVGPGPIQVCMCGKNLV